MPNIQDITTAAYRLLAADGELAGLCTVYKGKKRPANAVGPALTVEAGKLEPGPGEGVWTGTVTVTAYAPVLSNRMPDFETLDGIAGRARGVLGDAEIDIENGKALPLIDGGGTSADWDETHDGEARRDLFFGLVLVSFG